MDLTRNEAGELLQGALADGFRKECSLDQVLTRKPEFALMWSDLMEVSIVPVLEDQDLTKVLKRIGK
jgi:hypothetical protein